MVPLIKPWVAACWMNTSAAFWTKSGAHYTLGMGQRHVPRQLLADQSPLWVRAQEAWETRYFGDKSIQEPGDSVGHIVKVGMDTNFTPLLWLEELHKIKLI